MTADTLALMAKDRKVDRSATSIRGVRVSDKVWSDAKKKAADNKETISEVVRRALIEYAELGDDVPAVHGRDGGKDKRPESGKP